MPRKFLEENLQAEYDPQAVWGVNCDIQFIVMAERPKTNWSVFCAGVLDIAHEHSFHAYCGPSQLTALRKALELRSGLVVPVSLRMMVPLIRTGISAPILFDLDDILHRQHWRLAVARPFRLSRLARLLQVPAMILAERRALRIAQASLVCSEADRKQIARMGAGSRAFNVPNALNAPVTPPPPTGEKTVMFVGWHHNSANSLAAERLIQRIWPLVRRHHPDAKLLLAGEGCEKFTSLVQPGDGIELLGFVDDLPGLYARTAVPCAPITVAGGTRIKLIEAAAHARVSVATRVAAEGLDFTDQSEIILADTDQQIAAHCINLLSNPEQRERLGQAARKRMLDLYDATSVQKRVTDIAGHLLSQSGL